jgi:hypothetical protein
MFSSSAKTGEKKPFGAKGRRKGDGFSSGFKGPSVKMFTGECDGLKECVFDCSDSKQGGVFEANIRKISIYVGTKFDMGMFLSTLVNDLVEVEVPEPPVIANREIYKLQLVQYVKNQGRAPEALCSDLQTMHGVPHVEVGRA